jgi:hypothetical protein
MQTLRIVLILILGSGLMLSMISSRRDRQELQKVTAANDFLRKSLGEMSIALTAKDKEVDRLEQAPCTPAQANGSRKGTQAR